MKVAFRLPDYNSIENPVENKFPIETTTLGKIISNLLPYIFAAAGILLFIYLLIGGFQLLTSAGEPKTIEEAKSKITNAIIGFVIIFIAYWLIQVVQTIFGIGIE